MNRNSLKAAIVFTVWTTLLLSSGAEARPPKMLPYEPTVRTFHIGIPAEGWTAFEEETVQGHAVHFVGPDDPRGNYRTGLDIHWIEKGRPGFISMRDMIKQLRRPDKATSRGSSPIRVMRVARKHARVFEVTETLRLPIDAVPSEEVVIHHFIAVFPGGDGYFIMKLSSAREVFLDHRKLFKAFLKSFRIRGY